MVRIDNLEVGALVRLKFLHPHPEDAVFLGIFGEGEERRARFAQHNPSANRLFTWEAYRFRGGWVYGSSADRLRLVEVMDERRAG